MSNQIIPAEPGLRCVVWPRAGNYWTASSRLNESTADAVNQNCWSVIGWSIRDSLRPVPLLLNGAYSSLDSDAPVNHIALIHANGTVEWLGQFFTGVEDFVRQAQINESSQGK